MSDHIDDAQRYFNCRKHFNVYNDRNRKASVTLKKNPSLDLPENITEEGFKEAVKSVEESPNYKLFLCLCCDKVTFNMSLPLGYWCHECGAITFEEVLYTPKKVKPKKRIEMK